MQQAEGDSNIQYLVSYVHKFGDQCSSKEVRNYKNNDRLK